MKQKAYKLKENHRAAESVPSGITVYSCRYYDYGLASDDSRYTGIEHISVTLKESGDYPCFTVPLEDLELVIS